MALPCAKIILDRLKEELKPRGFRKHGQTFVRPVNDCVQFVDLQASQFGEAGRRDRSRTTLRRRPASKDTMMSLPFFCVVAFGGQSLQARTDHGHRSVFSVEVTYDDGTKAKETMSDMSYGGTEFVLIGKDPHGGEHQLWLDTIADLDVIQPKQIKLTFKDGRTMDLTDDGGFAIHTASPEGGSAEVGFEKVKHIRFLHPVRRDGLGNAIFDQWPFSPYTGKRVP